MCARDRSMPRASRTGTTASRIKPTTTARIAGCTRVLQDQAESASDRAIAHRNRGLAYLAIVASRPCACRLRRGDQARSEIRRRLSQPRPGAYGWKNDYDRSHRRLQRGDPAGPEIRSKRARTAARPTTRRRTTTAPSSTMTRRSSSTPKSLRLNFRGISHYGKGL